MTARRIAICAAALVAAAAPAGAQPRAVRVAEPAPAGSGARPDERDADRHFRAGVALFKQAHYTEALAEFQRAYEIVPHPLVLYNIAGCHRELAHHAEAATYYLRFLADGKTQVAPARLAAAQTELDAVLPLVARATLRLAPEGAVLVVDGAEVEHATAPLILAPGEHQLIARASGRRDGERTVRVAAGDQITVELAAGEPAAPAPPPIRTGADRAALDAAPTGLRLAVGAGFGTNLRLPGETGAPAVSVAVALGARIELGLDAVFVAYAIIPSLRVRIAGDTLALHVIGALPYALNDGAMSERFAAGALGLGVRYRPVPGLAVRLETYAAFAGAAHGTALPIFLGGERWF